MANRTYGLALVAALAMGAAACGGGSPASPTQSQTGVTGVAAAAPTSAGAAIRGVVETASATASAADGVQALATAAGVRVSVVGTALLTTTNASGEFEFQGLPAGRVELRFEASGIDARIELEGLAEGQTLRVNVHVSSSGAFLAETEDHRNETTLRGTVDAASGALLTVGGRSVQTDGLTEFVGRDGAKASLGDVRPGQTVEIEGTSQSDGTLYARKVKLEDDPANNAPETEVAFTGPIQSLSPLRVAGRLVDTDANTRVLDARNALIALSALKQGDSVQVEGRSRSDGSVLAKKIKLED